jgi:hypothetical protein
MNAAPLLNAAVTALAQAKLEAVLIGNAAAAMTHPGSNPA